MMPETVKQETVSENRHLSAKTETAATTPSPVTERSNPLINRHEAVLEEEVTVLQTRAETQRTAGETLFRRGMPREGADRSDPMSSPAPVASDPVTADAGGEQKPAAAPGTASAHVSPTAQAERAETPSSVGQQDRVRVVEQVLQKLDTMRLTQGRQEITLHLKPEHLGQLQVTIVTDRENVFARIVAETPQIRQAVESGRDALRDALEQKGLTLQQMDVSSQQGHGGGRQMPFIPDPYASGARPYRMPGLSTAEETEASHQAVITQSRLTGRLDYVA
jgi:flagellar hook-length control protein FliK